MTKIRKSITIDDKVNDSVEKQAQLESRSFSNMIETMVKKYLMALKKTKVR
jgi:predicted CopG family antitoxin